MPLICFDLVVGRVPIFQEPGGKPDTRWVVAPSNQYQAGVSVKVWCCDASTWISLSSQLKTYVIKGGIIGLISGSCIQLVHSEVDNQLDNQLMRGTLLVPQFMIYVAKP